MEIRMVDLKGQYLRIKEEMDEAIQNVISDTAFIKGKYVKEFTQNLETYLGTNYVIPCGNGTDALQLALMAMDYPRGSEIITTPFTFVATVEVICLLGLVPVFVDVDPDTFNIDPEKIKDVITDKTKAIIPVHLFGQSCEMEPILQIAKDYSIQVIEDTAQAIGAEYQLNGVRHNCGTMGDIGTLSFFPSKNLGCYGDGGAVMTNDEALAYKMNLYANHGSQKKYYYETIGINSRLDGLQAAILDVKLKYLDEYNNSRVEAADRYDQLFAQIEEVEIPKRIKNGNHVFHQYTIKLTDRDHVRAELGLQGIPTGIYYPQPLHRQGIYKQYVNKSQDFSVSDKLGNQVLSLPMHSELTDEMQSHIVLKLKEALVKTLA